MMRLSVDGRPCDMPSDVTLPVGFSPARLNTVEGWRTGRTLELTLPATETNRAVFGPTDDLYPAERFNDTLHTAVIEEGGVELFSGTVYLLSRQGRRASDAGSFEVRITSGAPEWARRAALTKLVATNMEFGMNLTTQEIAATWSGERAVRFLPVDRGERQADTDGESMLPVERPMLTDDYHPFIAVRPTVMQIFADAGYSVQSRFLDSDLARSLCFSGAFTAHDAAEERRVADFYARRSDEVTAEANVAGMVYASPSILLNSVGNIVDTADPTAVDEEGVPMSDTFARNGSFRIDDNGCACFFAPRAMSVGFNLHLEYRTDFRIRSRTRLTGFDRVGEIGGAEIRFALTNSYTDRRERPSGGMAYRIVVFDHEEGTTYSLRGTVNGTDRQLCNFSERSAAVTMPESIEAGSLYMQYKTDGDDSYRNLTADWALYDGHVTERGTTSVKVDLRLAAREVEAGGRVLLDKFRIGGAEEGMRITLSRACSLSPLFSGIPGYGTELGFADIAPRQVRQIDLIEALQHMFNLAIYTDEQAKSVCLEPLDDLYGADGGEPTDWSGKIDFSQPVITKDAALGVAQWRRFTYLQTDTASARLSADEGKEYGSWLVENPLYGAKELSQRIVSPLFTTTVNAAGACPTAPSALLPQVTEEEAEEQQSDSPSAVRILRYAGLHPLPQGEVWGFPHSEASYPLAAFHFAGDSFGEGFTLSFGDRDGVQGLHRYYDNSLRPELEREYMTLSLRLTPADVARLLRPDGCAPSFRSRFRLGAEGRSSHYRLVGLESYNPADASTRCTFLRLMED